MSKQRAMEIAAESQTHHSRTRAEQNNPLLLQSRAQAEQAPLLFPPFNVPKPAPLTQTDKELMERSRFLSETLKYSGYYVIPSPHSTKLLQAHALNGSSSGIDSGGGGGAVQAQIYTPVFERYSDRYRKILGKKNFYNEIPHPNPHLFPPELLSSKHQIHSTATFTSKVQFLSSRHLEKEVARLVAAGAALRSNAVGDERGHGGAAGGAGAGGADDEKDEAAQERKDADAEDEEEQVEEEAESDDMEEGGDYVDNYGDDDEDGGGDPLDDNGDEGETM